jgi:aryl-alcohol dehydrogenase-like predicted oxidoreductase
MKVIPIARDQGRGILSWSPLAGGLLSGTFVFDEPGPEAARHTTFDFPSVDRTRAVGVLRTLRRVSDATADTTGGSVARIALAWVLTRSFVTSAASLLPTRVTSWPGTSWPTRT